MKTITFSSIKGGVGKSSIAILTANILAANNKKVLVIDADPQNSTTFYYLPDSSNISESFASVLNQADIRKNTIKTAINNISLVPSSLELINKRNDEIGELQTAIASIQKDYDYCIIDTAPTFDSVVANCLFVADIIVTPVQFSNFDYKSLLFYNNLLQETGLNEKWKILYNKFKPIRTGSSLAGQFLDLYNTTFKNTLKTRIPDTVAIKQYFDTGAKLNQTKARIATFTAVKSLAEELTNNKIKAEVF